MKLKALALLSLSVIYVGCAKDSGSGKPGDAGCTKVNMQVHVDYSKEEQIDATLSSESTLYSKGGRYIKDNSFMLIWPHSQKGQGDPIKTDNFSTNADNSDNTITKVDLINNEVSSGEDIQKKFEKNGTIKSIPDQEINHFSIKTGIISTDLQRGDALYQIDLIPSMSEMGKKLANSTQNDTKKTKFCNTESEQASIIINKEKNTITYSVSGDLNFEHEE